MRKCHNNHLLVVVLVGHQNTGNGVNDAVLGHDVVGAGNNWRPIHFDAWKIKSIHRIKMLFKYFRMEKLSFHTPPVDHNLVWSAVQSGQHHISSTVFGVQSAQEISALGHVTWQNAFQLCGSGHQSGQGFGRQGAERLVGRRKQRERTICSFKFPVRLNYMR